MNSTQRLVVHAGLGQSRYGGHPWRLIPRMTALTAMLRPLSVLLHPVPVQRRGNASETPEVQRIWQLRWQHPLLTLGLEHCRRTFTKEVRCNLMTA